MSPSQRPSAMPAPLRWGVNYTPSEGWFHSWQDFEVDAVRADFESIAALGLDHVRIFPLWPLLQPNRTLIRAQGIADVGKVVDAAAEFGLEVSIDGLQGHLSSFDFLPAWVTSWHRRNIFTDPEVVMAQAQLITALAREVTERPNVLGMTLGNETNQFAVERHPDQQLTTPAQMGEWLTTLLAAVQTEWPGGSHQHSFDDNVWFVDNCPLTPAHAATLGDMTTVHSWIFVAVARLFPPGHPARTLFADYLIQLAAAYAQDPARPIWLQEIGAPHPAVPFDGAADFLEASLRPVLDTPNLWGVTWWCSHDVSRKLADFPELEHSLGLLDSGRAVKPAGRRLAELIAAEKSHPTPRRQRTTAVAFDPGDLQTGMGRSVADPAGAVFAAWLEQTAAGKKPALVRTSKLSDANYLRARGITDVALAAQPTRE
ncbi:glycoside hydrolase 5 family protein [Arthrobacter cryoconiti]|uniref:Glycosyl hydrolase n=1 Tax=Arthrobacter cryoconiti TaxID=748907 RepID=A0ABV8R2E6_9MICC|nr:glycosyl hydrolase [Arthrobacter cryoconiti]MCC9067922.1 glycosyl hydrolase [Arthrobacter cryoconiti]